MVHAEVAEKSSTTEILDYASSIRPWNLSILLRIRLHSRARELMRPMREDLLASMAASSREAGDTSQGSGPPCPVHRMRLLQLHESGKGNMAAARGPTGDLQGLGGCLLLDFFLEGMNGSRRPPSNVSH